MARFHHAREPALELDREAAGGEPEIEPRFDDVLDLARTEDLSGDGHRRLARHELTGREGDLVILGDEIEDLPPQLVGATTHGAPPGKCGTRRRCARAPRRARSSATSRACGAPSRRSGTGA